MKFIRCVLLSATLCLSLVSTSSHAFFFFFIPGSLFTSSDKKDIAEFHKKMDWTGLREFTQKKIDADASNADWWFQKGYAESKLVKWEDAQKSYSEAIRLQPSSYIAVNNLGAVYQAQGKLREALDQYLAALKVKNDYPLAMANAASMQYRLGRPDLAWDIHQELKQIEPAQAKVIKDRFLLTDTRPVVNVQTSTQSNPQVASPSASPSSPTPSTAQPTTSTASSEAEQLQKANALWDAKNFVELVSFSENWSMATPSSPNAWYYLGLGYYGQGAKDKSLVAFKEALRLKPDLPDAIGRVLLMRGEKSRIEEIYTVLAQIDAPRAQSFKEKFLAQ